MKILALELSSARGSMAWLDKQADEARDWPNDRKNSGAFFENIDSVTKKFGAPDRIIVGLGPGSYAGTRIAISAGIGLQIASGATLIGYPSICAFANAAEYCVIGDARRKSFFFARVAGNDLIEGPTLLLASELQQKIDNLDPQLSIFCSEPLPQFERPVIAYPSALTLVRLAREPQRSFSLPPLEPIYLREPHITMPK
ncbi:MAG: tRNA (adenosine(37)-N6)-threonylcarbamoyltransferase complex dimerization subunit type 1 TsaB [Chthoniobacterales bacterium]